MKKSVTKKRSATATSKAVATKQTAAAAAAAAEDAISLLKADHRKAEKLFAQYSEEESSDEKARLVRTVCNALAVHTRIEEEIFYPACREAGVEDSLMDEAQVEHDAVGILMEELLSSRPEAPFYDAKMKVLGEYVQMHVGEEEKPGSGIFAKAKSAGLDMNELGQRLKVRKQQLESMADASGIQPPAPRALGHAPHIQYGENTMARYNQERDDQGRFTSDDRGYSGQNGNRGGGSRYENDNRSSSMRGREDYDNRQYGRDRDDDRSSRGSGHGGWFGDPEGHSRASEMGWQHREDQGGNQRGRSSRGDYGDNDRGQYGRSRSDYDQRGQSGSRSDDDYGRGGRGHGGWFGDPEGHSRASELGWEHRGGGRDRDDDRGGRYGRSRSDDYGSQSNRGHGGWFGDPEGHSRAAERGWEGRRDDDRR